MAIPKVKITFDADLDQLKRGVNGAQNEVQGFGDKVTDFGKKAGLAFAAAGAAAALYAGKLLVDGVKSAMEDEAAQAKLAATLKNVTGATQAQVAEIEKQISRTSLLTGVTDDELRPSFERLVRSTKDSEEALKLQQLALDIAAGSGKSLESVSNALGKGLDGSTASLAKLGIGLSAAELKTMSMDDITTKLSDTFGGQAAAKADTFAGKMAILSNGFNEAKETVGSYIIDALQPMLTVFVRNIIPAVSELADKVGRYLAPVFKDISSFFSTTLIPIFKAFWGFMSDVIIPGIIKTAIPIINGLKSAFNSISEAVQDNIHKFKPFIEFMMEIYDFILTNLAPVIGKVLGGAFKTMGEVIGNVIGYIGTVAEAIMKIINGVISGINLMIRVYNSIPFLDDVPEISIRKFEIEVPNKDGGKTTVTGLDVGGGTFTGGFEMGGGGGGGGGAGSSSRQIDTATAQENVNYSYAELEAMGATGFALSAENLARNVSGTQIRQAPTIINNNVNIGVAGDAEGTARSIIGLLNGSQGRGTLGAGALVTP